jgi:hypothetical protein
MVATVAEITAEPVVTDNANDFRQLGVAVETY